MRAIIARTNRRMLTNAGRLVGKPSLGGYFALACDPGVSGIDSHEPGLSVLISQVCVRLHLSEIAPAPASGQLAPAESFRLLTFVFKEYKRGDTGNSKVSPKW